MGWGPAVRAVLHRRPVDSSTALRMTKIWVQNANCFWTSSKVFGIPLSREMGSRISPMRAGIFCVRDLWPGDGGILR